MDDSNPLDLLDYVREKGLVRPRDVEAIGIPRKYLSRLVDRGLIERVGRGQYMAADAEWTQYHTLVQAAARVPRGVLCLLTALRFHDFTTELPREIWMAVDPRAGQPRDPHLALRIVRFSGAALTSGIEEHAIEGVPVRVYSPAKTVVDCFKFRHKIGVEIAIEALRDCRRKQACTNDELWEYGKICRMNRVMQPYLEAVA